MKKETLHDVMKQLRLLTEIEKTTADGESIMVNVTLNRRAVAAYDREAKRLTAA